LHHLPIDPTVNTLSFYVVWLSHHIEPRSVDSYLSGIASRLEETYPDVRKARRSSIVARTLHGCKRRMSSPVQRNLPLSVDDLESVRNTFGPTPGFDDSLFMALLFTGFITLQRLGELTWPDAVQHQSYRKVPMRHTLSITANSISYSLPYRKNDALGTGMTILILANSWTVGDPLPILKHYFACRDSAFPFHPALWLTSAGAVPTRGWFLHHLKIHCGLRMSGHSMRAGGATALAIAGMTPDLIQ
ncbi:hypothetical protein BDR06DRAFT_838431, partial [Suillus hirtellus]